MQVSACRDRIDQGLQLRGALEHACYQRCSAIQGVSQARFAQLPWPGWCRLRGGRRAPSLRGRVPVAVPPRPAAATWRAEHTMATIGRRSGSNRLSAVLLMCPLV